jgi:hypothetical protein
MIADPEALHAAELMARGANDAWMMLTRLQRIARFAEVDVELHVDLERLRAGLLLLEHTVNAQLAKTGDDDLAHVESPTHPSGMRRAGRRHRVASGSR